MHLCPVWIQQCRSNINLCSPIWQQHSGDVTLSGGVYDWKNKNTFSCETATFHRTRLDSKRCDEQVLHNRYFQPRHLIGQSLSQTEMETRTEHDKSYLRLSTLFWLAGEILLMFFFFFYFRANASVSHVTTQLLLTTLVHFVDLFTLSNPHLQHKQGARCQLLL